MTNTELKAQIDTQITNETVDNSITPSEVGGNMKDTVDYTDQEVLVNKGLIDTNTSNIATNVTNIGLCTKNADTDVSTNGWVLDEDDMASDSDTKVPTQQSVKAYVDSLISSPDLEWNAQVFQSGTDDPIPQSPQTNSLIVGSFFGTPTAFRDVEFTRTGIGIYRIRVRYTNATVPTNTSKLSLNFGDAVCRVTSSSTGAIGGGTPYNYKEWVFETRTPAGVLEDDLLLGNNGGYVNIKLYS